MNDCADDRLLLAQDILAYAQDSLLVHLRFLEPAFSKLGLNLNDAWGFRTDGASIFYDPHAVVELYAAEENAPARAYLHMVLHCIFRHQFAGEAYRSALWDLAADVAVEYCISDMNIANLETAKSDQQASIIQHLRNKLEFLTAEKLYDYFAEQDMTDEEALAMRRTFFIDAHDGWVRGSALKSQTEGQSTNPFFENDLEGQDQAVSSALSKGEEGEADRQKPLIQDFSDQESGHEQEGKEADDGLEQALGKIASRVLSAQGAPDSFVDAAGGFAVPDLCARAMQPDAAQVTRPLPTERFATAMQTEWKQVALSAQVALEDFAQLWSSTSGSFSTALRLSNLPKISYEDFLRRFVGRNETVQINDDEFDYNFYCYGLDLYGNVPLVEPLEYTDNGRVKDFVIAVDTSASTRGEVVEGFLQRTFDILESSSLFASSMNLYLVQCDAQVQDAQLLRTAADVQRCKQNLEVKGFGGTDFRPTFAYVESLIEQGLLPNLKGLLYFTDGHGAYPAMPPQYDVAFVLTDSAFLEEPDVPAWAMRVNVETAEFTRSKDCREGVLR